MQQANQLVVVISSLVHSEYSLLQHAIMHVFQDNLHQCLMQQSRFMLFTRSS